MTLSASVPATSQAAIASRVPLRPGRRRAVPSSRIAAGVKVGAVLLLALVAVRVHELIPGARFLFPITTGIPIALALLLNGGAFRGRSALVSSGTQRHFLAYLTLVLIGVPFSVYIGASIGRLTTLLIGGMLVLVLAALPRSVVLRDSLLRAYASLIAVNALLVLLANNRTRDGRLSTGAYYDPNDLAAMLAQGVVIALATVIRPGAVAPRFIAFASLPIMLGVLLATGSRGGVIAVAAGAGVLLMGLGTRRALVGTVLAVAGATGAWATADPAQRLRIASIFSLEEDYNSTESTGRVAIWKRGVVLSLERPVLGHGLSTYTYADASARRQVGIQGKWLTAHNTVIQSLVEVGYLATFCLIAFLAAGFRQAFNVFRSKGSADSSRHRPELLAAMVAAVTAAMFLSHAHFFPLLALTAMTTLWSEPRH